MATSIISILIVLFLWCGPAFGATQTGLQVMTPIPLADFGTGSLTAWQFWYTNGDGNVTELAFGVNGTFMRFNGVDAAPSASTPAGGGDMLKATYDTDDDGDIDQAAGGLEADVSAYTGLIGLNAGAVSEVDTEAELEGMLNNVSDIFTDNDGALNDDNVTIGDVPTAAVTNGDTTHVPTSDGVYDFCETTQDYLKTAENSDNDDNVTLADVQSACSNDFHGIGGTDDDVPEAGDFGAGTDLDANGAVAWGNLAEGELADGSVIGADIKDDSLDSADYAAGSVDNEHLATGIDAVKVADGSVTNVEFQYINSLDNNAQTQITARASHAGQVYTGNHDYGGADFEFPQASPGAPDADGEAELDFTDGSLVVQHGSAHAELGAATDVVMGKLIKSFGATLAFPDLLQAEIDNWPLKPIEASEFPHGIVITKIFIKTSVSSTYAINVENWDDPTTINGANPTIDAITTSSSIEASEDTITYSTIAAGQIVMLDLPTTNIGWVQILVLYYEPIA